MKTHFSECVMNGILRVVFLCYAAAFVGWWWISPKGFGLGHSRFWSNGVIPVLVVFVSLLCLIGVSRRYLGILSVLMPAYPAATAGFIAAGLALYPVSMRAVFAVPLFIWLAVLVGLTCYICKRNPLKASGWLAALLLAGVATVVGAALPWSQRSAEAATRPLNVTDAAGAGQALLRQGYEGQVLNPTTAPFELSGQVTVVPSKAEVVLKDLGSQLSIRPLLTFYSRSPDRCWILFSPRQDRIGPQRVYDGMRLTENGLHLEYRHDGNSYLDVAAFQQGGVELEACCKLADDVYSHLNTFTQFTVKGKEKIYVSFSPCPEERIEVTAFDYPFGRPCRMAYLDGSGVFRVVQSASAEKGPFETLAEGPLGESERLEITLYDGDAPIYRIAFVDWAAQCSRQLSPTAGWGLPENAIEFSLDGENLAQATFYVTLASTSAGRGFDSVGHKAGVYRNRVRVEFLSSSR